MNFEKAINILGLKSNFTVEELKRAHRELVNKYHPDRNRTPEAEEKTKEINAAREYLAKYLKESKSRYNQPNSEQTYKNNNQDTFNFREYRDKKTDEIYNIIDFDFDKYFDIYKVTETIKGFIQTIRTIAFSSYSKITIMKTKESIDNEFNKTINEIKDVFKLIKEAFYKENGIDESNVEENINYDCTLEEFYEQLLKIKNKYSINAIIKEKYKELKRIVEFDLNEYKLSINIKNIIEKIKNVPENFNSVCQLSLNKVFAVNFFFVKLDYIKKSFKELEDEFYKEININKYDIEEIINYDCTLKEFYQQMLKIKEKYSKEEMLDKFLEEEILKYINYPGYERVKTLVRYCKNITLKQIKENNFNYTQKDIEEMHKSILEYFRQFNFIQQKLLELEIKTSKLDGCEWIKNNLKTIKNKFKTTIKFDELENSIKELEKRIKEIDYDFLKESKKAKEQLAINNIYIDLVTRYSETLKKYNIIGQESEIDALNQIFNDILNLFKQGIKKDELLDFFTLFNKINFEYLKYNNSTLSEIKNKLNNKKINKSKIYLKIPKENQFNNINFYYLIEEDMQIYEIPSFNKNSKINKEKISETNLEEDYISIEEFLNKATFIGENRTDYLSEIYGLIYELHGYSIYLENNQICIAYNKTFLKTDKKEYIYLDEFANKQHLIDLITKEIENKLEEELNRIKQTSESHYSHSYDYSQIFGDLPRNYDSYYDTYEDNNSRKR